MKNETGITLIAVILTVIILAILATISISIMNNDDIINKTKSSMYKYNQAVSEKENEMDGLLLGENSKLSSIIGKKTIKTKKYLDEENNPIVIPAGFTVLDVTSKVSEGIVIEYNGNEFVWVPVEDPERMYETRTVKTAYNGIKEIKVGKLYDDGDINKLKTYPGYDVNDCREPALLTDINYGDVSTTTDKGIDLLRRIVGLTGTDEEIVKTFEQNLINEFDEMIESVKKYKGFFVGRYETSLDKSKDAQSKKEISSATGESESADSWYGLYQKQKEFSKNNNLVSVGSSMIWGSQYDQMMIWMPNNKVTVINNNGKNTSRITGTQDADIINNVYDLYGNSVEWTLEANGNDLHLGRSGSAYINQMPTHRFVKYVPVPMNKYYGSRLTLYIK